MLYNLLNDNTFHTQTLFHFCKTPLSICLALSFISKSAHKRTLILFLFNDIPLLLCVHDVSLLREMCQ